MAKKKAAKKSANRRPAKHWAKKNAPTAVNRPKGPARSLGEQVQFSWTYDDLAEITGMTRNTVAQHKRRGAFDPENLESVIYWLFRNVPAEKKAKIIQYAFDHSKPQNPALNRGTYRSR